MTPWQFAVSMEAEVDHRRHLHDELICAAWHSAVLARVKKMPPLKDLLSRHTDKGDVAARLKATLKSSLPIRRGFAVSGPRR